MVTNIRFGETNDASPSYGITNILRQSVGWFDNKDSNPGCLTTKLARDAPIVKAVS